MIQFQAAYYVCNIRVPEGEEGVDSVFDETINPQIQEAQQTLSTRNMKKLSQGT